MTFAKPEARELITESRLAFPRRNRCLLVSAHWVPSCRENTFHEAIVVSIGFQQHICLLLCSSCLSASSGIIREHRPQRTEQQRAMFRVGAVVALNVVACEGQAGIFRTHPSKACGAENGRAVYNNERRGACLFKGHASSVRGRHNNYARVAVNPRQN